MEDQITILYNDALSSGYGNPSGQNYSMYEGEVINNLNSINFNDKISALWIHPRINVNVTTDLNFTGKSYTFEGQNGSYITVDKLKGIGFQDNITSVKNTAIESLDTWKKKCCRNIISNTTDQNKCGKYWNQRPENCGNLGCTGDELMNNSICQTWCKNNPQDCDTVKIQFCHNNPGHQMCGCILDTEFAKQQRLEYSMIPGNRQCWPGSDCQKTDLVDTFITTDLNKNNCTGDITAQISKINNSGIMLGNTVEQSTGSVNYSIYILIFIIVTIVIISVVSIIYFYNTEFL